MRAVQVSGPKAPFELVERAIPEPGPGTVRIRVEACGICHSDAYVKDGMLPGIDFPRIPGHEVVGVIDAAGAGVDGWTAGQRVGVGWNGGYCGRCPACRHGDLFACEADAPITGITCDGGYAEFMVARAEALALLPDGMEAVEAAPLLCAGVTTYNALRSSGARAGDLVAVLGLGGLGHLGVQFAAKMGYTTVAIARGAEKEPLARKLGAEHYVDSVFQDPAAELGKLGGARVVLATDTSGEAVRAAIGGLGVPGTFLVLGAPRALEVPAGLLIAGRRSIQGWYSGTSIDSQETLAYSRAAGVRSMNEVYPLERAAEAYERMLSGKARFRVVLGTARGPGS